MEWNVRTLSRIHIFVIFFTPQEFASQALATHVTIFPLYIFTLCEYGSWVVGLWLMGLQKWSRIDWNGIHPHLKCYLWYKEQWFWWIDCAWGREPVFLFFFTSVESQDHSYHMSYSKITGTTLLTFCYSILSNAFLGNADFLKIIRKITRYSEPGH